MSESPISVLSNNLRDLAYAPVTVWSGFFRPTFVFGNNIKDIDTEHDVVNTVGSYGSQLNRILDAMVTLIDLQLAREELLDEAQLTKLLLLKKLAEDAERATRESEGS